MDGPPSFGQALHELRLRHGLSLAQLSRLTHYSRGYLSRVENGHRPPSDQLARQCETVLGAHGRLVPLLPAAQPGPAPRPATRPAQLPADVADFTGRGATLARLDGLAARYGTLTAVPVAVLAGLPGAGKTALAVHWAHQVASRFPDGALYADLRGHDRLGRPAQPADVLEQFLRALGVAPAQLPAGVDGRSALLRTLLDSRRMLILLDNAGTADQVRPLLPGAPGSFVVVTSRSRMSGLVARNGAHRIPVGPLPAPEAVQLLGVILGPRRVAAEPASVDAIAVWCAGLPLALRIAADRASADPGAKLAELADRLADERARLDALAAEDDVATAVRAVFSWSYAALPAVAARMFRLLGLHAGPDVCIPSAAALAGLPLAVAAALLDELAGAHLLEEAGNGRYRFHDLVRSYAAERARDEETAAARGAATGRNVAAYLHAADAADRILMPLRRHVALGPPPAHCAPPPLASYEEALAWCDAEQANLTAVVVQAAEAGLDDAVWQLAVTLWGYCCLRRPADWIAIEQAGLAAARRAGDVQAEAWVLNSLGTAYFCLRQFGGALGCYRAALAARRRIGDHWGEGLTLNNLGELYWELDRLDDALACHTQALDLFRRVQNTKGEGITLDNLGATYRKLGRPADALRCLEGALAIFRQVGDRRGEGMALHNLAAAYAELGQPGRALDHFRQALGVRCAAGDRHGEAVTLRALGAVYAARGQSARASGCWRRALPIFEAVDTAQAAELREFVLRGT